MPPAPLPAHPRLFASLPDWENVRAKIQSDPVSARLWVCLQRKASSFLSTPSIRHKLDGIRLLAQSRLCIQHVVTLAAAARISGDKRYALRAIDEMRDVARFTDWNPSHFLDVAEMASAIAIGFDWLHEYLSPEDRDLIATALKDKALRASFDGSPEQIWWVSGSNNWNQVCHAGMSLAAIAVAETWPDLAEETLRRAVANIPKAAAGYAPDGAYPEGAIYWGYGTMYHVLVAAALEHLCHDTHGLDAFPGFEASAEYMMQVTSPRGFLYNYSDSEEKRLFEIPLFWFARRFQRPDLLRYEVAHLDLHLDAYERDPRIDDSRFLALALLWREPALPAASGGQPLPLNWYGRGHNPVAVFRSAWDDPRALYAGIKGGSPRDPHTHMDSGSFILEADGVRWAIDLDKQDYHSLECHGIKLWGTEQAADRWKVFRLNSASHNILRFNRADQWVDGRAEFIRFQAEGPMPHAIVNLDSIYQDQVASARRGLAFLPHCRVLLQDEWEADQGAVIAEWQMLTRAEVTPKNHSLLFQQNGQTMTLQILEPEQVEIEIRDVSKPAQSHDVPNPGVRQVLLRTTTPAGATGRFRILALFGDSSTGIELPPLLPLQNW